MDIHGEVWNTHGTHGRQRVLLGRRGVLWVLTSKVLVQWVWLCVQPCMRSLQHIARHKALYVEFFTKA